MFLGVNYTFSGIVWFLDSIALSKKKILILLIPSLEVRASKLNSDSSKHAIRLKYRILSVTGLGVRKHQGLFLNAVRSEKDADRLD